MYWVMRTTSEWKNKVLHVEIESRPRKPQQEPFWWGAEPIQNEQLNFRFFLEKLSEYPDSLWTATEFDLFSSKLISILDKHKIKHEIYPTAIIDKTTHERLNLTHQVCRLLEVQPALDVEKSQFVKKKVKGAPEYSLIKRMVLKDEFVNRVVPITRLSERRSVVLIHNSLKEEFSSEGITGFYYIPVTQYQSAELRDFFLE